MCGIVGIYAFKGPSKVDRTELRKIRDFMLSRGPDGQGEWFSEDGVVGLGHRRLAIIDLTESAAQPMRSQDGRYCLVYNGEIYNYRELRSALEEDGARFQSQSDTEVLLHLFIRKGAACVHLLRGMFAFALWDAVERRLFVARDPYGIKPLYYSVEGGVFRLASQVKALLAGGAISRDRSPEGSVGFLLWGSVPEPFTSFASIQALPAGSYLSVDATGAGKVVRYWTPSEVYNGSATRLALPMERDPGEQVRTALKEAVRCHLEADVPVAVFLSAGIDSSVVAALAKEEARAQVTTVTLAFEEFRGTASDESLLATSTARYYGTEHRTVVVSRKEFDAELPRIWQAMDQPTIDGVNTYFVARAAAREGFKVALSGLGGDELFGGYPSFRRVPAWHRWLRLPRRIPWARRFAHSVSRLLVDQLPGKINPKVAGLFAGSWSLPWVYLLQRALYLPEELDGLLDPELLKAGMCHYDPLREVERLTPSDATPFGVVAALEQSLYMRNQLLRDADWAGMAHSVEIRVPLVDRFLASEVADPASAHWDPNFAKHLLAASPRRKLPADVSQRAKTGFSVPVAEWMKPMLPVSVRPGPWGRAWSKVVLGNVYGGTP